MSSSSWKRLFPPEERLRRLKEWDAHVRQQAGRTFVYAGWWFVGGLGLGFLADVLFLGADDPVWIPRVGVLAQIGVLLAGIAMFRVSATVRAHPHPLCTLFSAVVAGIGGVVLGSLGGMDGPYFYVSYLLSATALGLPAHLGWRIGFNLALLAAFFATFFGLHPEHANVPHAHVAWLHLTCMSVGTIVFGHVLHLQARELFMHRAAAEQRGDALVEEVALRTERLVAVTERAERVREEERQDIARLLHDDMAQLIVSARINLEHLERSVDADHARADVRSLRQVVSQMEHSTRSVVGGLRAAELPFEVAAEDLVEAFRALGELAITLELDCAHSEPARPVRHAALRTIQESLSNVLKHADAKRATVRVTQSGGTLIVSVTDDGRGLDPARRAEGFGLEGMRERASSLGGSLSLSAATPRGTEVRVALPLRAPSGSLGFSG